MSDLLNFYVDNNFKKNKPSNDDDDKNDPNNPNNKVEKDIYEEDDDDEPDVIPGIIIQYYHLAITVITFTIIIFISLSSLLS